MLEKPLLLQDLLPEQLAAVTCPKGPLLIVAGAGTGKTTVITRRLAWLILENKVATDEILALTFTDKAAGEMEERVDRLLPYGYVDLWISTFHAFGERVLREHGLDIGLPGDFKLLDETETWLLTRRHLDKFNLKHYRPRGNPAKFIHALLKHFSRCKDELIEPADYLRYAENLKLNQDSTAGMDTETETQRLNEVANAFHVYNQLLLENNALDFADLINYTLKLLETRPRLLEKYRQKFQYLLVDEFQDTNLAQYQLIKLLAAPKNNLTVVGDDDQSIYKFRGASVSNILHFKTDYSDSRLVTLTKNFRSTQNILDLSYTLIKNNNPDRLEARLGLDKKLSAQRPGTGQIETPIFQSNIEEADAVAKKIIAIKETNAELTWNDFAILLRANSSADDFMQALEQDGIPFQFMAAAGLYRQPLVLDITAYLRLLDNYHENAAMYRVLNLPWWKIDTLDLIKLNQYAKRKTLSLYEALRQAALAEVSVETRAIIDKILALTAKHTALARVNGASRVVLAFLEESGYLGDLTSRADKGETNALRQINHLNAFYRQITEFEKNNAEKNVKQFLTEFDYILESGDSGKMAPDWDEGPEAVKIFTVHGAKGLEFRYVFIPHLVDQKFPSRSHAEQIELPDALVKEILPEGDVHLQEERRLFYVALTRAKDGLWLSRARFYDDGKRERKASRFLFELDLAGEIEKNKKEKKAASLSFLRPAKEETTTTKKIALPEHFSFTQIKVFETCPLQYKLAHLLHLPTRGRASFSFGRTMHLTLQKFMEQVQNLNAVTQTGLFSAIDTAAEASSAAGRSIRFPLLAELEEIYKSSWVDEWFDSTEEKKEYQKLGSGILSQFHANFQKHPVIPKYLEIGFHLKVDSYLIKGQIDRVDPQPDGAVELIDYKTGAPKTEEKIDWEDKKQLLLYQLAAIESLREKVSSLSLYYLENNTRVSFLGAEKDLTKLRGQLTETIAKIKQADFQPTPSPFICRFCDFKKICEAAEL